MASKSSPTKSQRASGTGNKSQPIRKLATAATAAVKLAAKQQNMRTARARQPQPTGTNRSAVVTKRFTQPARSAPVAFDGKSLKPFMRVTTNVSGDSYRAHVLDRLDPVIITTGAQNITGALLVQIPINTSVLGERLRRISSCYEYYKFITSRFHFVSSLGTIYGGSLLGFIDSDPVDTFNQGITSLKEAAAHPSAAAHKIWNDFSWTAPPAPPGRFYVDVISNDPASVRQQQQGSFVILLDSAITLPGNDIVYPLTLGNLYVEYVVDLSYPTIQSGFVGSFVQSSYLPVTPFIQSSNVNGLIFPMTTIGPPLVENNVGNRAIELQAVAIYGGITGIVLRPGVNYITWAYSASTTNATAFALLESQIYSTRSAGLLLSPEAVDYSPGAQLNPVQNGSQDGQLNSRAGLRYVDNGALGRASRNCTTRIVVPANDLFVWFPALRVYTPMDLTIYDFFIEILSTTPTTSERKTLSPSTASDDINARIAAIEAKFSADESTCIIPMIDANLIPASLDTRARSQFDHDFTLLTTREGKVNSTREPAIPGRPSKK